MATKRKPKEAPRLYGPPLERPSTYQGGITPKELEKKLEEDLTDEECHAIYEKIYNFKKDINKKIWI